MTVRTRFAPSPTGYMHIGGMRTALFNWLFARHNNGQFILRIDDTDQQRNVEEALGPILQAFRWLGLDWDEGPEVGGDHGPYFQSQRGELYHQALDDLLLKGKAYRDFDPPDVVKADREAAEKEKRNYMNIRRSLELSDEDIQRNLETDVPYVIRLFVPRDEKVAINDAVRGEVEWDCSLIPDPVIMRSNGSPLYNFASVIDDAQLKITHIIRAEEHLSNAPIQVLLFGALGYEQPQFAHIPFITAPGSNKKLSKRDLQKLRNNPAMRKMFQVADNILPRLGLEVGESVNPITVEYYERLGFLSEAIFNALSRLGWSLDDKTENMSRETVIENFTLERVIKSPAGLDPEKLMSYQEHWMGQKSLEEKVTGVLPCLQRAELISDSLSDDDLSYVGRVIVALDDRLKTFSDILQFDDFFMSDDDLQFDEKAIQKRLIKPDDALPLLKKLREKLATVESFDAVTTEAMLHQFIEEEEIKVGQIIHALRVAVSGKSTGPGMFDCLELLGRERCLARMDRAIGIAESASAS